MNESIGAVRPEADAGWVASPGAANCVGRVDLELRVVSSTVELDALRQAWSDLHLRSGASVFQSYEWQRTWWAHFGETEASRSLHVIVLTADREVVAIAPFVVEAVRIAPFVSLRRLVFLGTGTTDYLDLLVQRGLESICCARIAAHLAQESSASFDVVSLSDIPECSASRSHLFEALRAHGFEGKTFVVEQCPRAVLKGTWKETLDSFEGGRGQRLVKRVRKMKQRFRVELEVSQGAGALGADIDEFMVMHQHRWTSAGKKGVFAERTMAAFQRAVAQAFFDRGWLFLAFLRIDGRRVAAMCSFKHRGDLSYYLGGLVDAGEASKHSPGLVFHCLCMEELIPRGIGVYDFLRGSHLYKYRCGAVDVP